MMVSTAFNVARSVDGNVTRPSPDFVHKEGPITIEDIAKGAAKYLISDFRSRHRSYLRVSGSAEALFLVDSQLLAEEASKRHQTTICMGTDVMPFLFLGYAYLHHTYMTDFSTDLTAVDRIKIARVLMPSITTFYLLHAAGLISINPDPTSTQNAQYVQNIVWHRDHQKPPKKMTIRNYLRELSEHEAYNYFAYDVRIIAALLWLTQENQVNRAGINELARKTISYIDTVEVHRKRNGRAIRKFVNQLVPVAGSTPVPQEISSFASTLR